MPAHTKVDRLIADITSKIASGEYAPGHKLPSAREMQQIHGISRQVVITAIDRLRERGLIETVPGSGAYVAVPSGEAGSE